jgi:hypothetical protein
VQECFDGAQHEREISTNGVFSSVRPFDTQAVRPEPFGYAQDMLGRRKRPATQAQSKGEQDFFSEN